MNIIAGRARGRRLETLAGEATRPTQAKVRAALFSMLASWLPEGAFLDLFAGSGAMGLEAASRGASRVVLVENAPAALTIIDANVKVTGLICDVLRLDVSLALKQLVGQRFDVIFLDPPYALDPAPLAEAAAGLLVSDGRLVIEHGRGRELPEVLGGLERRDVRRYSDSVLTIYAWPSPAKPDA